MTRKWLVALLVCIAYPMSAFSINFESTEVVANKNGYLFEIHGSNTIGAELAPNLIATWLTEHKFNSIEIKVTSVPNEKEVWAISPTKQLIKILVAAHGSGTGFEQIRNGRADIAAASRPIKPSENALFPTIDLTQYETETVLAIDGLAIITHPDLSIPSLTISQVGELFSGKITNWQQLGGPNLTVSIHARDDKSGTFDTFKALVLSRGYQLKRNIKRYESNDQLAKQVSSQFGAIGFTAFASIGHAKAVAIIDGESQPMLPKVSSIAIEDYPLSRRLYLYQANSSNAFAKDFLSFVKSPTGQNTVANSGFVSQNLTELSIEPADNLPNGYRFIIERSMRLTTNFRFSPGEKTLDNKAQDDLLRIQEYMARPENQNRSIMLVAFANKQNSEFRAQLLSEARALRVKQQLNSIGIQTNAMTGYGEMNPVADNTDEKFALRNLRVEVWIR
ncbi:substrate-binding domain-containing protein [Reinekea sp.]|uniref:substrate-binding domain-containing protein n=1 Tax=Reinekea sp. TaxID=1970455 RepID=UPI003988FF1E